MWLLFLCISVVFTSFLSGILGMAGGMVLMGILLALVSVQQAMVLHAATQLASNGWRALLWHRAIAWRVGAGYAAGAAVAVLGFGFLHVALSKPVVLIILGLTPFTVLLLPRKLQLNVDRSGHPFVCGLVCMAVQLLAGVSGPLLDTFFVASRMDRRAVVATKAAVQALSHASRIAFFGLWVGAVNAMGEVGGMEDIDTPVLVLVPLLMACAIAGTSVSRFVLERMSDADFRSWTRRAVLAVGSAYLATGLWTLTP